MERLRWYLNRARIMPLPEYGLRALRAGSQLVEQRRVESGWQPGAGVRLHATTPLYSAGALPNNYLAQFPSDTEALERLVQGRVEFFGQALTLGKSINWHQDPVSGVTSPLTFGKTINYRDERNCGDIKVLWEISRHQHLVPMAVAFAVTGEPRFRDAVVGQIDSWVAQNPYGRGVHWCSSLEVALRSISWSMVHSLFAIRTGESGILGCSSDRGKLERSIYQHGYFIEHLLSRYSSANNHLIGELVGLHTLASVFDFGPDSDRWGTQAKSELEREAVLQVFPDGVAREQAVHYHLEVLEYLLFAWCVGSANNSPLAPAVLETIQKMAGFITALHPGKDLPPRIGDSDEATINRLTPRDPVDAYADILAAVEAVLSPDADCCSEKAFWYRSMAASEQRQALPLRPANGEVRSFPDAGYSVVRTDRLNLVFDAGPLGYPAMAAHGHADALSFCFAVSGVWWLIDPGTYTYHLEHEARDYFRGTQAHNTLTVNGANQSEIGGPFMWVRSANASMTSPETEGPIVRMSGEHDGYERSGVRHRRDLLLNKDAGSLEVVDRIQLQTGKAASLELNFHFAPEVTMSLDGSIARGSRPDTKDSIQLDLDEDWDWRLYRASEAPMSGWYSPKLGVKVPTWTLRGTYSAMTSQTVVTHISTAAAG